MQGRRSDLLGAARMGGALRAALGRDLPILIARLWQHRTGRQHAELGRVHACLECYQVVP